ncbi:leucine-rich repeat neuronal protein 3-like [Chironomus tepperi]|uniref:leucine-rich repeat neuronal protein 3-like n=1 Tax=Chironomus tepperi TaxID=113505 RepID=UPI00391F6ACF
MKLLILTFASLCAAYSVDITTPKPTIECSTQNCIISFANMDDAAFEGMITEEQSGILALKFSSCQIDRIPNATFDKLPSLLCLMVTSPGLSIIEHGSFLEASNLQFLYLPGNRIKKLLGKTFAGASNLNDINLSDNEIEVISEDAFDGLEHLESLNLSRNQIAFFAQATFSPLADLVNLDISGNTIEFLDARLFINNKNLNGINMADNQIMSITNGFLDILQHIKVLNIMNNPCTNDTELETVPLVKIVDSKDQNIEDEDALDKCYQNFLDMADPESTDLNDLLSKAEIVREDIEADIIADLTEQLRERDVTIKELERQDDLLKIVILLFISVLLFFGVLRIIIHVVNSTYQRDAHSRLIEKDVEVIKVDPKQIVYTIDI